MKRILFAGALLALLTMSCNSQKKTESTPDKVALQAKSSTASKLVGGNRDAHGCIGSAGYTWSEAQKDCIRLFEKGIRLSVINETSTNSAFLVFSPDSSKVEVFPPDGKPATILEKNALTDGKVVWKNANGGSLVLSRTDGEWIVSQNGTAIYRKNIPTGEGAAQTRTFTGSVTDPSSGQRISGTLAITSPQYSGDGTFVITYSSPNDAQPQTITGKRYTQRGTPDNNDATVWQLVGTDGEVICNLLVEQEESVLTLLDHAYKPIPSSKLTRKVTQ